LSQDDDDPDDERESEDVDADGEDDDDTDGTGEQGDAIDPAGRGGNNVIVHSMVSLKSILNFTRIHIKNKRK
jgi:hypothetical protein